MNEDKHSSTPSAQSVVCPICHGEGELLQLDEEVGCQVRVPCWRCKREPAQPPLSE